jgi:predicted HAD superfamily phosphohydrolase YqeG
VGAIGDFRLIATASLITLDYHVRMQRVVFIDVDDTLVRFAGSKRIPIPAVIALVRQLKQEGATLFLWSTGGAEYCKNLAGELGIEDCFVSFLPKPTVYIDDQPVHEWKSCKHLYPSQAENA